MPARAQASGPIYTADERGNSVSAIDLASGRVMTVRVPVSPHNVQATADGRRLLAVGPPAAAGGGHAHGPAAARGRLLAMDTMRDELPILAEVPVGRHPAHVVADATGRRAYVTNGEDDTLSVIDLEGMRGLAEIRVGRYPHGLRLRPDGLEAWVANVRDGSVSVVDLARGAEAARIAVGPAPVQVGFTPDGARAFVSLRDANAVAEMDVAARRVLRRILVGRGPIQVYATPDGRLLYVANEGTRAEPGRTVSAIDIAAGQVVATVETGRGAHGVVVAGDGARAYVTNIHEDTVAEIEVATQRVLRRFAVGGGPNGITWSRTT